MRIVSITSVALPYIDYLEQKGYIPPNRRAWIDYLPDFSVALFRPDFMLASEKYPMKAHKNQQLLAMLCSPDSLMEPGARGQTIVPEVQKPSQWPCMRRLLREVCSQLMREKHFHGVSSASPHAYSLKSRYGKVSSERRAMKQLMRSF